MAEGGIINEYKEKQGKAVVMCFDSSTMENKYTINIDDHEIPPTNDKPLSANQLVVEKSPQKRDVALDLLKLIAALMVVLSHCLNNFTHSGPLYNAIWLIQMPLFMVVSGMLSPSTDKVDTIKKAGHKFLNLTERLLWPCLTCLLIMVCLGSFDGNILTAFVEFYEDPSTNLWFLWVLFLIEVVYLIGLYISSLFHNQKARVVLPFVFCFLVFVILLLCVYKGFIPGQTFGIKLFVFYLPFYCLGSLGKMIKNHQFQSPKKASIVAYVVLGVASLIFLFEIFYFKSTYEFDDMSIKYLLIRVLGSVSACYLLIFGAYKITRFQWIQFVSKGGKFLLECYYLHILFMRMVNFEYLSSIMPVWIVVICAWFFLLFLVAASLAVCYFIPFLHVLIFGKSWSYYAFEKRFFSKIKEKAAKSK